MADLTDSYDEYVLCEYLICINFTQTPEILDPILLRLAKGNSVTFPEEITLYCRYQIINFQIKK